MKIGDLNFCDSCGLPIIEDKLKFGTLEDGSPSGLFCELCFHQGRLLTANLTKEQIIEQSTQAYVNRFGWKNLKNARFEAKNSLSLTSRFGGGGKRGVGLSWRARLIILAIFFAVWIILKFLP